MQKCSRVMLLAMATLVGGSSLAASVDLGETVVRSDYVEVNRLKEEKEVIVIRKKDLEKKGYQTLEEVLQDVPSINVGLTGAGDIDIRGQGGGQAQRNLQVMLDGAPITILTSHPYTNNYNYIPVENIEKIEIVPGGGSVLYGSGASGGVINITTNLKSMDKPKRSMVLSTSSNERYGAISIGDKASKNISYQINYTKGHKDLYYVNTYRDASYFSIGGAWTSDDKDKKLTLRYSKVNEEGQNVGNLNYQKFKTYGKNWVPADITDTVGIDEHGQKIQRKVPGYLNLKRNLTMYSLNYVQAFSPSHTLHMDAFYVKGLFNNNLFSNEPMHHDTKGVKVKYDIGYGKDKKHHLLVGVDKYTQEATLAYDDYKYLRDEKKYVVHPLYFHYEKAITGLYATNTLSYGKLSLTQGLRFERVGWGYDKEAAKSSGKDERISRDIATQLGVSYQYNDVGRVYAHFETGFTHPDGLQAADDWGQDILPTKATDETFRNFELGWNDRLGKSYVQAVAFYSATDNQIDRFLLFTDQGLARISRNLYNTKRMGVELSASQKMGKWQFKESYAFLKGRQKYSDHGLEVLKELAQDAKDFQSLSLRAVPRHKFVFTASYQPNAHWEMSSTFSYVGKYKNYIETKDADSNTVPSHTLWDMDVAYKDAKHWTVHVGVKNLLNTKYAYYMSENTNGYYSIIPGDERTYYVKANYTF